MIITHGEHQLKRLSWVRGLLRAWIVASVLWVSGAGLDNYQSFLPRQTFDFAPPGRDPVTVAAPWGTTREQAWQYTASGDRVTPVPPSPPKALIEESNHPASRPRPPAFDPTQPYSDYIEPELPSASYVLAIALLPSLTLLIVGLTLRWIIRGFRPRSVPSLERTRA